MVSHCSVGLAQFRRLALLTPGLIPKKICRTCARPNIPKIILGIWGGRCAYTVVISMLSFVALIYFGQCVVGLLLAGGADGAMLEGPILRSAEI